VDTFFQTGRITNVDFMNMTLAHVVWNEMPTTGPGFELSKVRFHNVRFYGAISTAPGVLDLSNPADEVQFHDDIFSNCRLSGTFKAPWFRNSSFFNCTLPDSLSPEGLAQGGKCLDNIIWKNEPLD